MRFAYADPPYLSCCGLYGHHHGDDDRCWDDPETHRALIERLQTAFPDGWGAVGLQSFTGYHLAHVPTRSQNSRLGEAVLRVQTRCQTGLCLGAGHLRRGPQPIQGYRHAPPEKGGKQTTPKDFLAESITLKKGLTGAKPAAFCRWVLDLLNVQAGDELIDLYPGTGIMGEILRERLG